MLVFPFLLFTRSRAPLPSPQLDQVEVLTDLADLMASEKDYFTCDHFLKEFIMPGTKKRKYYEDEIPEEEMVDVTSEDLESVDL